MRKLVYITIQISSQVHAPHLAGGSRHHRPGEGGERRPSQGELAGWDWMLKDKENLPPALINPLPDSGGPPHLHGCGHPVLGTRLPLCLPLTSTVWTSIRSKSAF